MTTERTTPNVNVVPAQQAMRGGEATAEPANLVWQHAKRTIWTERMLAALGTGPRRRAWYSLADKAFTMRALEEAANQVCANDGSSGIDRMTIDRFEQARDQILPVLYQRLQQEKYRHREVRRMWIPKLGKRREKRPLGIPTVIDRIVQTATRNALEPIFENQFHDHSYGFRPGRSAQDALGHVVNTLTAGACWVIDADLKSFFDTIDHDKLMDLIREDVTDGRILRLLQQMLEAGVVERDGLSESIHPTEAGTPQGGVISPLLANIFLNDLDHQINTGEAIMIRYADDFVICCHTEDEAHAVLEQVRQWTASRGLVLHPEKTKIVDMNRDGNAIEFLGYSLKRWPHRKTGQPRYLRLVRQKSVSKFRAKIRPHTKRANGHSLEAIIGKINPILRGFGNFFRSAQESSLRQLDQWVRMRLRSILRKRRKRKGRGRGLDHNRWPNAFFTEQGLISLTSVHAEWCRSLNG